MMGESGKGFLPGYRSHQKFDVNKERRGSLLFFSRLGTFFFVDALLFFFCMEAGSPRVVGIVAGEEAPFLRRAVVTMRLDGWSRPLRSLLYIRCMYVSLTSAQSESESGRKLVSEMHLHMSGLPLLLLDHRDAD
jgi:hypothetical protein